MANTIDIAIRVQSQLDALQKVVGTIAQTQDELRKSQRAANGFGQALRTGLGIDLISRANSMLVGAFRSLVGEGLRFNSELEKSTVAFKTLLGSAGEAQQRMQDLVKFASTTPYGQEEVIAASRLLQALTDGALASGEGLRLVGDAAAAVGRNFQETAMWVGRLYAGLQSGTPVGEATLRLLEMGLISGDVGKKLNELAQNGALGTKGAMDVLRETFGKTTGAMDDLSKTAAGLQSTLKDTMSMMAGEITRSAFEFWKERLTDILRLLGSIPSRMNEIREQVMESAVAGGVAARSVASDADKEAALKELDERYEKLRKERGRLLQSKLNSFRADIAAKAELSEAQQLARELARRTRGIPQTEDWDQGIASVDTSMRLIASERARLLSPAGNKTLAANAVAQSQQASISAMEFRQKMFSEEDAYFNSPEYYKALGDAAFERWQIEQKQMEEAVEWRQQLAAEEEAILETLENEAAAREYQLELMREQNSFTGILTQGVMELDAQWGNLGGNTALVALDAIQAGVRGVTDGIMGAIEGTRSWGETFAQVGRQIIANLIQVVVQWVAQMTLVAALKRVLGIQDNTAAAQSAAAWAPAAIAASIASYGSAALIGTASYAAALLSGTALTTGISFGGAREHGGDVNPYQAFLVGERGPELFVPGASGSIIDASATSSMLGSRGLVGASGGTSQPQINPKFSVAFVDDRQKFHQWLRTADGEQVIIDIFNQNKMAFGRTT